MSDPTDSTTAVKTTRTILFVCTGNTCRSPMAEALFRLRAGPALPWRADSAGLWAGEGQPASAGAIEAVRELGADLTGHRSRAVTADLVRGAGLILGVTQTHVDELRRHFPEAADRIRLLSSFGSGPAGDLADPIGMDGFVYRRVRDDIDRALADVLLYLYRVGADAPARPSGGAS